MKTAPRILMVSQRNIFPYDLWRSPHYEFEDIIGNIDAAEIMVPSPGKWFRYGNRIAQRIARHSTIALNPGIPRIQTKNRYDMLFAFCSYPRDLIYLDFESDWKKFCDVSICMVDEIWVKQIPYQACYLKLLSKFDYVILYYSQSVKSIGDVTGKKCFFLPPGIDCMKFCPYPNPPQKTIDVYNIGRRSEITHRKLLELSEKREIFYVYDSISGTRSINLQEHRSLLANMAKRSRFYIVNPGLIDLPDRRGDQIEIGNRYFEGAASGCIMIGEIPENEEFDKLFDWKDAVIHSPFHSDRIHEIIEHFNRNREEENAIQNTNVLQSLKRHDWVYRWESVLKIAGMEGTPGMAQRKEQLGNIGESIVKGTRRI